MSSKKKTIKIDTITELVYTSRPSSSKLNQCTKPTRRRRFSSLYREKAEESGMNGAVTGKCCAEQTDGASREGDKQPSVRSVSYMVEEEAHDFGPPKCLSLYNCTAGI